ncbi:hypothetical protein [Haloplasma contractile]|uniref:Uncharacterized protein n=1 Tax=Haloplasma contractile SSD-17B TaxID=1033810 RepID=U2FKV8_9MOLU|nr:hypothetical protein [Haloplasma contractile]ERJ11849.1 hypothetical protein HLPCO_002088 [Haloplasma contractile SSD-17B]
MNTGDEKQVLKYLLFYASILLLVDIIFSFIGSVVNQGVTLFPFMNLDYLNLWKFGFDLPTRFIFNFGIVSLVYLILKCGGIDLNERFIKGINELKDKLESKKQNQVKSIDETIVNSKKNRQTKKKKPNRFGLIALIILLISLIGIRLHYGTLFIFEHYTDERLFLLISSDDLEWLSNVIIISVAIATGFYMLKFFIKTVLIDVMKSVVDVVIIIIIAAHPYRFNQDIVDEYPVFEYAPHILQTIFFIVIIIVIIELIVNIIKFMIELIKQGE